MSFAVKGLDAHPYLKTSTQARSIPSLESFPIHMIMGVDDTIKTIFSNLNSFCLMQCTNVCKDFYRVAHHTELWAAILKKAIIGKDDYKGYLGRDAGTEPNLPSEKFYRILKTWPSISKGKAYEEAHQIILFPAKLDKDRATYELMTRLVKNPLKGHAMDYDGDPEMLHKHGKTSQVASRWFILQTETEGCGKNYGRQLKIVASKTHFLNIKPVVPQIWQLAILNMMVYLKTGKTTLNQSVRSSDKAGDGYPFALSYYQEIPVNPNIVDDPHIYNPYIAKKAKKDKRHNLDAIVKSSIYNPYNDPMVGITAVWKLVES